MAKKSKGFRELLKQQQQREYTEQKALARLQQKVQTGPLGNQFAGVVTNPEGEVKMSEVLENFVEPYLGEIRSHREREKLFSIAMFAWNIAIFPEEERSQMIQEIIDQGLKGADLQAWQDIQEIIEEMVARKQQFFADNQRYIMDFQLHDTGNSFYLSVASTLDRPTDEPL